jgi:hypothetical protein
MDVHPANAAADSLGDLFPHQPAGLVSLVSSPPPLGGDISFARIFFFFF